MHIVSVVTCTCMLTNTHTQAHTHTHAHTNTCTHMHTHTRTHTHTHVQMAEMYGELMELNERLHKSLAGRDAVITTLVGSMRQAGLQVRTSFVTINRITYDPSSYYPIPTDPCAC